MNKILYIIKEKPSRIIYAGYDTEKSMVLLNRALNHGEDAYRMETHNSFEQVKKKYKVDDFSTIEVPETKLEKALK